MDIFCFWHSAPPGFSNFSRRYSMKEVTAIYVCFHIYELSTDKCKKGTHLLALYYLHLAFFRHVALVLVVVSVKLRCLFVNIDFVAHEENRDVANALF